MDSTLNFSIFEIILMLFGAIALGYTIHFFIFSIRNLKKKDMAGDAAKLKKELQDVRFNLFDEIDKKNRLTEELKNKLADAEADLNIYTIEAEEARKESKELKAEREELLRLVEANKLTVNRSDLEEAQISLREQYQKLAGLIGDIDMVKETQERNRELEQSNEALTTRVNELINKLAQRENEINYTAKKQMASAEVAAIIDSTYNQFTNLQERIQKLEARLNAAKMNSIEFEEIKESFYKATNDLEELKAKNVSLHSDKRQLESNLVETEDKLREANFQRQQLQKKVTYLEQLNNDMQTIAETNKKLQAQIKRIGELESLLNMAREKDDDQQELHEPD
jgi:chromosome segregation ATPase